MEGGPCPRSCGRRYGAFIHGEWEDSVGMSLSKFWYLAMSMLYSDQNASRTDISLFCVTESLRNLYELSEFVH